MKLCECGCNGEISDRFPNGRKRPNNIRFIIGHNSRNGLNCSGSNNGHWKGGIKIHADGYIMVRRPEHHFATIDGYVMYHRLVYELYHGCSLMPWADVHHKNGRRWANFHNNLEAMMHNQHTSINMIGNRYNIGQHRSPNTEFKKGLIPWSKGKKCVVSRDPNTGRFLRKFT